ncbi:T6SS immunity protein Tli3 family protein [Leminorella grimontii]|uniref:T6SS immunity protein Tli3 family protein n=1 Tax=Leminorella grimontii TaxID=82981 RepID=UPI00321F9EC5
MNTPIKAKKPGYVIFLIVLVVIGGAVVALGFFGQLQSRLSVGAAFGGAGFDRRPMQTHYSTYDIEPQVIYRLDDNRYVELSNNEGCQVTSKDQWVSEVWYYDRNLGIKTKISSKIRNYQGRIINADLSGKNLIFPVSDDRLSCSDRNGCGNSGVLYSTDYGRTLSYWALGPYLSSDPSRDSKQYTIVITEKELIAYKRNSFIKMEIGGKTINGMPLEITGSVKTIPSYPVVMDHYQCDANIKPKSVGRIAIEEYDERDPPYFDELLLAVNKTISALDKVEFYQATLRTHYAVYDVAPQVIYRLDDSRYVELSNYSGCQPTYEDERVVGVWYYDLRHNIRTRLFSKMRSFQGRIINADPSGKNLAFPVTADKTSCEEELCGKSAVYYSTDYGRTFNAFYSLIKPNAVAEGKDPSLYSEYSKHLTVVITDKNLTVYGETAGGYKFASISLDKENQEKPDVSYGFVRAIPSYSVVMDHYQCDANIKPRHVGGISVEEYRKRQL